MKKKIAALAAAFILGGAIFADNHTKGIDLQIGIPIAVSNMTKEYDVLECYQTTVEAGGQFKLASYDCFLLNDMLGIYGSLGVNTGVFITANGATGQSKHDEESESGFIDGIGFNASLELMIGPAFGVNLGSVRFQTGLAFHAVFAWGFGTVLSDDNEEIFSNSDYNYTVRYKSFGFALTPQFRFTANKRCSFIIGCDITFDFPNKLTYENEDGARTKMEFDNGFRFGATPYLGLGINF